MRGPCCGMMDLAYFDKLHPHTKATENLILRQNHDSSVRFIYPPQTRREAGFQCSLHQHHGHVKNQDASTGHHSDIPHPMLDPHLPRSIIADYDGSAIPSEDDGLSHDNQANKCIQEVVIAVLGTGAVGKSKFVQLALDIKNEVSNLITRKKVSLEGSISCLNLVEVGIEDSGGTSGRIVEPSEMGSELTTHFDGALILFNVLDPSSIAPLPVLLGDCRKGQIPAIVVATNCDAPSKNWRIDYGIVEHLCSQYGDFECFQTSILVPATHKRCISIILRNIVLNRHSTAVGASVQVPKKAISSSDTPLGQSTSESDTRQSSLLGATDVGDDLASVRVRSGLPCDARDPKEKSQGQSFDQYNAAIHASSDNESTSSDAVDSKYTASPPADVVDVSKLYETGDLAKSTYTTTTASLGAKSAILRSAQFEASDDCQSHVPDQPVDANDSAGYQEEDGKVYGVTFEDLVDRLLAEPMSKSDSRFPTIFLCLYRKFAAPSELLLAIVQRFDDAAVADTPSLVRMTVQLRYLARLQDWITDFPGDFAHPISRRIITNFVQGIANQKAFAVAYHDIITQLEIVCEDDDTEWACSDRNRSRASTMESFLTVSSLQSATSTMTADSSMEDTVEQPTCKAILGHQAARLNTAAPAVASIEPSSSPTTYPHSCLQTPDNTHRQAQSLLPVPKIVLNKVRWHQVMEISEESIARELTRIDWILYSSIRSRDLIRHISLTGDERVSCKGLEHVNQMIDQFNHTAFWVANWILLRDKPKHRAKALEKFMGVAWKLRHLNNYNSLGAVIAGINGTAVHRLGQTWELVSSESQKQFMRLEILMGTQKSHFAYRLAWENTSSARIPFLPLHRKDLVIAEEANQTFVASSMGDVINWKKFEVMGQAIIEIRKSQQLQYQPFQPHEELQRLLLDGIFSKEDDELYERSIQVERPRAEEQLRRKLPWFQR